MNKEQPIGVFDSGIGGLSVLRQLIRFMPFERYIYLGDTARVPYGNKSPDIVRQYAVECTEFLLERKVKLIVVACNTASSVAMEAIRIAAGDIPVIGMILPAAAAAVRATIKGKIGIIGTRATIGSNAYSNAIQELLNDNKIKVYSKACPLFVPIVEEGWTRHSATRLIAEEYLEDLKKEGVDTLVLGCTHYPLLSLLFTELMPGINLIDTGEHASVHALRLLAENNVLADEGSEYVIKPDIDFYVTDVPSIFYDLAKQFLGFSVDSPQKVILGSV
jgi:glutamate racemase